MASAPPGAGAQDRCAPVAPAPLRRLPSVGIARLLEPLTGSGGAAFLAALAVANVGNFVFHAVVSRRLGPADYGALSSLLSVLLAVSLPTAAIQVAVTHAAAVRRRAGERFTARPLARQVAVAVAIAAVLVAAAGPVIAGFLRLESAVAVWWLAAYLIPAFVGMVARAILLAELRFVTVAAVVVGATAARVALALALVAGGNGVVEAMAVSTLAETALAAVLIICARRHFSADAPRLVVGWSESARSAAAFTGVWALLSVDVVLARRFLSPEMAGSYAAAATLARAALFLPQAIAVIAHARASGAPPESAAAVLRASTAATVAVGAAIVVGLAATTDVVVGTLFGAAYAPAPELVAGLAVVAGVIACLNLFVHYRLARGLPTVSVGWIGLVAMVAVAAGWHGRPLALVVAAAAGAIVAALLALPRELVPRAVTRRPAPVTDTEGDALWSPASVDVSVVIPYFNSGPVIADQVVATAAALRCESCSFEIVAVDDGSTDGSGESLSALRLGELRRIRLSRNRGKGEALRRGFRSARGRWIAFIDGDGDLDPAHLPGFVRLAELYQADVVVGSKRHPHADVVYPPIRRVYSWGYQQLVRTLLRVPVRDTQVGVKLFDRKLLAAALPHTQQQGFVFDLELLAVAARLGRRRMVEAPVRIGERFASTVSMRTVARMLADTFILRSRVAELPTGRRLGAPATDVAARAPAPTLPAAPAIVEVG